MKITDAWVDDPTERGVLMPPLVCIEIDQMPDVTIEPKSFDGGWTVGKYGPFIQYRDGNPATKAGDFNVRFARTFPPVVDVSLFLHGPQEDSVSDIYSINVARARQLLRKWDRDWRLLLSDREAQDGSMTWVPSQMYPKCRFYYPKSKSCCGMTATGTIRREGVELPVCKEHLHESNRAFAARRATTSR